MASLLFFQRTIPAFRHSHLFNAEFWITTRTPLYYLDLAVPNDRLFKEHYERVFCDLKIHSDVIGWWNGCRVHRLRQRCRYRPQYHPDDNCVGSITSSNLFYLYVPTPDKKWDTIGVRLFHIFARRVDATSLASGDSAIRLLNLATFCGYQQWSENLPAEHEDLLISVFDQIYPSILKGIYEKRFKHPLLLKTFWDVFCVTEHVRLKLFEKVPDKELLKFMLDVANDTRFDFWGYRYGNEMFIEFVVLVFVEDRRFELLSVLLDYGFTILGMDPRTMAHFCNHNACRVPLNESFLDYKGREFFPNGVMLTFLKFCYHRSRTSLMELSRFKEVYQKLSRSVPLPSLPPSILRKILLITLERYGGTSVDKAEAEEAANFYESSEIHPTDHNVVAPCKLSHLSRCVIRDRLAANYQLPTAIENSDLPTLIKRFLRLDF